MYLTSGKEERSAMGKIVNVIALQSPIYDADFSYMLEGCEFSTAEDLISKVEFVLANPLDDVRRDVNIAHSAYDTLVLGVMKDLTKVLGEIKKPESHGKCFSLLNNLSSVSSLSLGHEC